MRFVYRHFPLTQIHPHAQHAAEMAVAAGERGRFWQMHDFLFRNQHALEDRDLVLYESHLGIPPEWAANALRTHAFAPLVRQHFMSGVRSGVNGTPTFFINGVRHDGGWDERSLLAAVQNAAYVGARGGQLTITTTTAWLGGDYGTEYGVTIPPGRYASLIVSDTGNGMEPATLARMWEPFFSTKAFGRNTGFGLSMVYGAVKQSGGFVWAESEPGQGTVMKIHWPEMNRLGSA